MKENEYWEQWHQDFLPPGEIANEPASDIYYPIQEHLYPLVVDNERDDDQSMNQVVGIFGATFFWRDILKNILANSHDGIIVVFENPCSSKFTYQIK
jgi:hypothetical protein